MADSGGLTGKRWRAIRQFVINRDTHCSICGEPVDKTLSGTHPRGPQAHHVLPKSRYPDKIYDPAVIALAHTECNQRAGDKVPDFLPDAEPSRNWLAQI